MTVAALLALLSLGAGGFLVSQASASGGFHAYGVPLESNGQKLAWLALAASGWLVFEAGTLFLRVGRSFGWALLFCLPLLWSSAALELAAGDLGTVRSLSLQPSEMVVKGTAHVELSSRPYAKGTPHWQLLVQDGSTGDVWLLHCKSGSPSCGVLRGQIASLSRELLGTGVPGIELRAGPVVAGSRTVEVRHGARVLLEGLLQQ
jgi:hypothetical protein